MDRGTQVAGENLVAAEARQDDGPRTVPIHDPFQSAELSPHRHRPHRLAHRAVREDRERRACIHVDRMRRQVVLGHDGSAIQRRSSAVVEREKTYENRFCVREPLVGQGADDQGAKSRPPESSARCDGPLVPGSPR